MVYALDVSKGTKSHKTRFFTNSFVTSTYGLKQLFTTWVHIEITCGDLKTTNTWAQPPDSHLIGLSCSLNILQCLKDFLKTSRWFQWAAKNENLCPGQVIFKLKCVY